MPLHPLTKQAYQLLHDGVLALAHAEQQGIRIDVKYAEEKHHYLTRKIQRLENELKETKFYHHWEKVCRGKVNINSGPQLEHFLYNVKKLQPMKFTETKKGSVDDEALQQLHIPELDTILEIRKLKKIRDTYLNAFIKETVDGVLHPFFNLHLVRTFRSSSSNPNFQNMPKRDKEAMELVRSAILPRLGHQLWEADFSGIEVRVAAAYHKDKTMLKYLHDLRSDMHGDLAKQLFKVKDFDKKQKEHAVLRQAAKNGFVFPEFYGDYYKNCAAGLACTWGQLPSGLWVQGQGIPMPNGSHLADHMIGQGINNYEDFTEHVRKIEKDFWENRFPEYAQWKLDWYAEYEKNGYADLLTGFRVSGLMGKNNVINYPVQGAAFHCLLWSFIQMDKFIIENNLDTRLVGQIHDSIVLDVNPKEAEIVEKALHRILSYELKEHFTWINCPMEIEVDKYPINGSWTEVIKS